MDIIYDFNDKQKPSAKFTAIGGSRFLNTALYVSSLEKKERENLYGIISKSGYTSSKCLYYAVGKDKDKLKKEFIQDYKKKIFSKFCYKAKNIYGR